MRRAVLLAALLIVLIGVAVRQKLDPPLTISATSTPIHVTRIAEGLEHPWGLAFLPDGRMLVTERPGRLRIVSRDGTISPPLAGVPAVHARGQGGLLDVALAPDFATSRLVYLTYAEPGEGGASTAAARARLTDDGLQDLQVIFRQQPKVSGDVHWGSRLAFAPDGTLFISTGDRGKFDPAQDLNSHLGKIIRIYPDGRVPADNPFVGRTDARPEIWSYGHRNIQGMAIHPLSGKLWAHEMGPRGGDELNIPAKGRNYGWPLVSWGTHYNLAEIPLPPTRPDLADAVRQWTPVIAPCGMAFYTANRFPGWRGSLLIGGLRAQGIVRLTLDGEKVVGEELIALGARTRDVRQGPDGLVYALTDAPNGALLRISPGAR